MADKYEISLWEDYIVATDGDVPEHYEERKIAVIGSNTMTADCRAYEPKLVENINGTNTFTFKMYYTLTDDGMQGYGAAGTKYTNPFLNLLINERKVKVFWKDNWYDLVIKNCDENTSDKSITYTCKDLFINELSKNGFNLTFDEELENNYGTAVSLGKAVLDGTDWQVDEKGSSIIQQTKEEPVYEVILNQDLININNETTGSSEAKVLKDSNILIYYNQIQTLVNSGTSGENQYIQFAYTENYEKDVNSQLVINADCYSFVCSSWETNQEVIGGVTYNYIYFYNNEELLFKFIYTNVSNNYRAERLVKSQSKIWDTLTSEYCSIYDADQNKALYRKINSDDSSAVVYVNTVPEGEETNYKKIISPGDEIYCHQSIEYKNATAVNNLIVNSSGFTNLTGWEGTDMVWRLWPDYDKNKTYSPVSYIKITPNQVFNSGIRNSTNYLTDNGFQVGDKYIFRYRAQTDNNNNPSGIYTSELSTQLLQPEIGSYTINSSSVKIFENSYWTVSEAKIADEQGNTVYFSNGKYYYDTEYTEECTDKIWVEYNFECKRPITKKEVYVANYGIFFVILADEEGKNSYWLEEAQFYPLVYGQGIINNTTATVRINPGDVDIQSLAEYHYVYYNHTANKDLTDVDQLEYLYSGTEEWDRTEITPRYNSNFEKIRTISGKESNRFNLLQTIAETFECWCKFTIKHDDTGRMKYVDGVPQKFVSFVEEIGKETGIGFIYGIDLKSITRSIDSDQIVTKTIVKQNTNESATNGFCTIARSDENPTHDTFILNFDYYISQGLLDANQVTKDLYNTGGDSIGYYPRLYALNTELANLKTDLTTKNEEYSDQNSLYTAYSQYVSSLNSGIANLESDILELTKTESIEDAYYTYTDSKNNNFTTTGDEDFIVLNATGARTKIANAPITFTDAESKLKTYDATIKNRDNYEGLTESLKQSLDDLDEIITSNKARQEAIEAEIEALHLKFYKKYSHFIQEGTWQSEDYIDDTLYYLDALSVAYTSSRPQISYNISVLRLSALEEYKNKVFHLGDISFIQDAEFFGYTNVNGVKTPYKEKVLVSEITSNFDNPSQDNFVIQNYKTQFEDLFQRITSTTQSLQYASGEYARAASVINTNGTIKAETIQESLKDNSAFLVESVNSHVVTDDSGITLTAIDDPSNQCRITASGIFISTDGGLNWNNAVRGDGISTQYLTSGTIGTNKITITDGTYSTFRWDSRGINAYMQDYNEESETYSDIHPDTYVRFDRFGIYGVNGVDDFEPTKESEIWDTASFGLTWNKFFMKNIYGDHYVEISSTDDIRVVDSSNGDTERIKIGKLTSETTDEEGNTVQSVVYGMRISDKDGNPVLETSQDGLLWLEKELWISSREGTEVRIGSLGDSQVINANDTFIVYEDGSVTANNITLGTYAKIGNYLSLGNAYIYNPSVNNNKFISVNNDSIYLTDTGILKLGSLTVNGTSSTIIGDNWSISPDYAVFNNVKVSGTLSSYVMETDKTQSVGGSMIFKDSYTIDSVTRNDDEVTSTIVLTFEDNALTPEFSITADSYIWLVRNGKLSSAFKVNEVTKEGTKYTIIINTYVEYTDYTGLIDIGEDESVLIGINSGNNSNSFLKPRGLTVSQFDSASSSYDVKLFLGDLGNSGIQFGGGSVTGYGLYSENVFLNGSLVTETNSYYRKLDKLEETDYEANPTKYYVVDATTSTGYRQCTSDDKYSESTTYYTLIQNSYAGVNTTGEVHTSKFTDDSKIIFWAGAASNTSTDIQEAPFQITDTGNLYANKGTFEGAIITKSTITGADIYTARIHGTGTATDENLVFYNATNGIVFKSGDWDGDTSTSDESKEIFTIGASGLKAGGNNLISINTEDYTSIFKGNEFQTIDGSIYLSFKSNLIYAPFTNSDGTSGSQGKLTFSSSKLQIGFNKNEQQITVSDDEVDLNAGIVNIENTVTFSDKMKYQKAEKGYNLYVFE